MIGGGVGDSSEAPRINSCSLVTGSFVVGEGVEDTKLFTGLRSREGEGFLGNSRTGKRSKRV